MLDRRRRRLVAAAAALPLGVHLRLARALPQLDVLDPIVKGITGGAALREGRVTLDIPHLSDNGHAVPLKVTVDSPMTAKEHVRAIHVLSEKNPRPVIGVFHLNPFCGRAEITTRIRLNGAQNIVVIAALSDGSFWASAAEVIVTETACLDAT